MAVPTVTLARYELDMAQLKADFAKIQTDMKGTEAQAVKSTEKVQESFKKASTSIENTGHSAGRLEHQFRELGNRIVAALAIESIIEFGKASLEAFEEAERASRKLLFALDGNQKAYAALSEQAENIQSSLGIEETNIKSVQAYLASMGLTAAQIKKVVDVSLDLSAVTGEDLQSSATKLAGTYEGVRGRLGKYSDEVRTMSLAELEAGGAVDVLGAKFKGLSTQISETELVTRQAAAYWQQTKETIGGFIAAAFVGLVQDAQLKIAQFKAVFGIKDEVKKATEEIIEDNKKVVESVEFLSRALADAKQQRDENATSIKEYNKANEKVLEIEQKIRNITGEKSEAEKKYAEQLKKTLEEEKHLREEGAKQFAQEKAEEVKRTSEQLKLLQNLRISNMKDEKEKELAQAKLDYQRDLQLVADSDENAGALREEIEKKYAKKVSDIVEKAADKDFDTTKKKNEKIVEEEKKKAEKIQKLEQDAVDGAGKAGDAILQFRAAQRSAEATDIKNKYDDEQAALQEKLEKHQISQKQFDKEKKALDKKRHEAEIELKRKNDEAEKKDAVWKIVIAGVVQVAKDLIAQNYIQAGIDTAVAGAQVAIAEATPLPKYAKGTLAVKGGKEGSDSVPALLMPGEAVIPTNEARKHNKALSAMLNGGFDEFVLKSYLPRLLAAEQQSKGGLSEKMVQSLQFNDRRIVRAIERSRVDNDSVVDAINKLGSKLEGTQRNSNLYKRGK